MRSSNYHRIPDDVDALIGQAGYSAVVPSAGGMEPFSPATAINDARQRWLFRMVHARRPLQEKMALFWHQHFATAYSKIANAVGGVRRDADDGGQGDRSTRPGCGDRSSCSAITRCRTSAAFSSKSPRDPAMLYWLDGRLNTKARPQENFAREVMELFTIGVGQFTESDVYAGARVFTGWNLQRIGDGRDPPSILSVLLQRCAARHERQDVQLPDLRRRFEDDSRARGVGRNAGRVRSHHRAGAASGNGAPSGAQALVVFHQRDSAARRGLRRPHRNRLHAERLPHGVGRARRAVVARIRRA